MRCCHKHYIQVTLWTTIQTIHLFLLLLGHEHWLTQKTFTKVIPTAIICLLILLILYLMAVSSSCGIIARWLVNNDCKGRNWLWPNLRYYSSICIGRLRKTMNNLKITSIRAQILNQDLQNKNQEHYPCDCNIRSWVILFMTYYLMRIFIGWGRERGWEQGGAGRGGQGGGKRLITYSDLKESLNGPFTDTLLTSFTWDKKTPNTNHMTNKNSTVLNIWGSPESWLCSESAAGPVPLVSSGS